MRLRRALTGIHRWAGLSVGLLAIYFALTGLGMLFKPQLQGLLEGGLRQAAPCSSPLRLDDLIAASRAAHPSGSVRQVELVAGGHGVTVVRYTDLQGVYVDSCRGSILGEQARWGGIFGSIEKLHRLRFLDSGDLSELLSGSASVLFATLLVAGGLVLWWPRSRMQLRASLKLPWGARGASLDARLHRTVGMYVALVLLASSVAAWTMTFDWARNTVFALTLSTPPAAKPQLAAGPGAVADADTLLRRVLAAVPAADAITLAYPRKPRDPVEVTIIEADAPHQNAKTMLYLDPASGAVLRLEPYASSSSGYKLYRWLGALHMGAVGGVVGHLVLLMGMAGVPVLAFTGIRSWLRRRRLQPQRRSIA